jgi:cyclopropane fatty-acyl-phospholipid synthase-like methyltransferase
LLLIAFAGAPSIAQVTPAPEPVYLAPPIATPQPLVEWMLRIAEVGPDDVVMDLGCGDGRIVITAVREFGAAGICLDLDQRQLQIAREKARAAGVEDRIEFVQADAMGADVREATVVTMYFGMRVHQELAEILEPQMAPGERIVTHQFPIKAWTPTRTISVLDERRFMREAMLYVIGTHRVPIRTVDN